MLDWLIGMAGAISVLLALFSPRCFVLGVTTFIAVGLVYPSPGGSVAFTAASVAIWLGLMGDIIKNYMDTQEQ